MAEIMEAGPLARMSCSEGAMKLASVRRSGTFVVALEPGMIRPFITEGHKDDAGQLAVLCRIGEMTGCRYGDQCIRRDSYA